MSRKKEPKISCENVRKIFREEGKDVLAIDELDLDVGEKEFLVVQKGLL